MFMGTRCTPETRSPSGPTASQRNRMEQLLLTELVTVRGRATVGLPDETGPCQLHSRFG